MDTPVPDLRVRDVVPGYPGMHPLVADLVLPEGAPMSVMSTLETSRELVRHSYYRYEFATVAVTHALSALEQVLAERLGARAPLRELITRAAGAGLVSVYLAGELERALLLRERLATGSATSATVNPVRAVDLLRAVFDSVALLLPGPEAEAQTEAGAQGPHDRLARLWEEHRSAPFPASFRGVDIDGTDLVLLDADVAGLVRRELDGGLDGAGVAALWSRIAGLATVVPVLDEAYCAAYFTRLRTMADLAAGRHLPDAT
ncbi:hypothetical protein BX285_7053 [Streptomyces sp. 1114.5]|uniref:hypothetical protein n=1 Tax=Streptomyces sp. 1114.5 TaxID=1938830 RepID=UPI000EB42D05|nr:hypothetical protein [Streptomyces sp. 1114.5]RKT08689.1 hypothetical protein BX285_7053 [Streptomyces sp. 1114.5]